MIKVSSKNPYFKLNLLYKETFVLKKPLIQAQFSPFFKNYMYLRRIFDFEKLVCPPDPSEAFYLTTLQEKVSLTTLCIDGWGLVVYHFVRDTLTNLFKKFKKIL